MPYFLGREGDICLFLFLEEIPTRKIFWARKISTGKKFRPSKAQWHDHCVKSVCIRSYSSWYEVSLRIKSKCGKIRTRITPNTDTIYAALTSGNFTIASKYLVSWRKQCRWLQCRPVEWDSGKSEWQDHECLNSDPTFIKTG